MKRGRASVAIGTSCRLFDEPLRQLQKQQDEVSGGGGGQQEEAGGEVIRRERLAF